MHTVKTVVPNDGNSYSMPIEGKETTLAISDGEATKTINVTVQAVVERWTPTGGIRLEGFTTYRGRSIQVIAYYELGSTEEELGRVHLLSH